MKAKQRWFKVTRELCHGWFHHFRHHVHDGHWTCEFATVIWRLQCFTVSFRGDDRGESGPRYTLGKKGCYTPIEDNKSNVDRTFVFPLGWNWHDMDPWLFPNEIRHYLRQTFNARSSGIVELRNHSIGGRSPKSIFTLWQLWINICKFFKSFSDCSNNAPSNPYGY